MELSAWCRALFKQSDRMASAGGDACKQHSCQAGTDDGNALWGRRFDLGQWKAPKLARIGEIEQLSRTQSVQWNAAVVVIDPWTNFAFGDAEFFSNEGTVAQQRRTQRKDRVVVLLSEIFQPVEIRAGIRKKDRQIGSLRKCFIGRHPDAFRNGVRMRRDSFFESVDDADKVVGAGDA